jgi:hypothetical protein
MRNDEIGMLIDLFTAPSLVLASFAREKGSVSLHSIFTQSPMRAFGYPEPATIRVADSDAAA